MPPTQRAASAGAAGRTRSLAEGIVSCGVAPAPTGVAQSFRGRDCEALGPTADYDGTLQPRQRANPRFRRRHFPLRGDYSVVQFSSRSQTAHSRNRITTASGRTLVLPVPRKNFFRFLFLRRNPD
ncbi:hypothetical protein HPB49_016082 [Dermacentor silvarum]|uniref:Uncharacterized protein n=2 Tax=Dermacentor silvarum TaxID=543639 RepID=A0ACB8CUB4_DERSI|nr:hypothetical protein HPB49_000449 [Dermacentor silvarum]KAH7954162.1 hypothetical protein HPB49_016082 [Dermacentor silvarum]